MLRELRGELAVHRSANTRFEEFGKNLECPELGALDLRI